MKLLQLFLTLPAKLKGMKFGRNVHIGPGYFFLTSDFHNVSIGDDVVIGANAYINPVKEGIISIGSGSNIGRRVTLSALKKITIGKNCLFGYDVSVLDHDHDVMKKNIPSSQAPLGRPQEVVIGDDSFVGAHSFILKGVRLGKHCVVGAGSVVTKSYPSYSVIAGSPARLIRTLK